VVCTKHSREPVGLSTYKRIVDVKEWAEIRVLGPHKPGIGTLDILF
jgi:hypothetical protein